MIRNQISGPAQCSMFEMPEAGMKIFSIFLVVLMLAGGGYFFGQFATWFTLNLCYSEVISIITDKVKEAGASKSFDVIENLEKTLTSLPLRGYESECVLAPLQTRRYLPQHQ